MKRFIHLFLLSTMLIFSSCIAEPHVEESLVESDIEILAQAECLSEVCNLFDEMIEAGDDEFNLDNINLDDLESIENDMSFMDYLHILFAGIKFKSEKARDALRVKLHELNEKYQAAKQRIKEHMLENQTTYMIGGISIGILATCLLLYYFKPACLFETSPAPNTP